MASLRTLCLAVFAVAAHAMTFSRLASNIHGDDACAGCEYTVDLRCAGIRSQRGQPFHRIQDCLVPLYGLIKLAEIQRMSNTSVCAITWMVNYEGLNLTHFLRNVSSIPWHKIIDEREACSKQMKYHTVNRTKELLAKADWIENFGNDQNMIAAYPIDVASNLWWLQRDVQRVSTPGDAQIVIIHRKHRIMTGYDRSFRPDAFEALSSSMHSRTGLPITVYVGNESMIDTVQLFSHAAGVVGYHGAAWVNTYFTVRPHCNVQISTFYDLESKLPWRISSELMLNPHGQWYFYYLPLSIILDANHIQHDVFTARTEKDHFIKDLDWVPLRGVDVADMTSHMVECVADPEAYNRSHPQPLTVFPSQGWSISSVPSSVARYIPADTWFTKGADSCTGCDLTVDLRCDGLKYSRNDYFNQVVHCLIPMYEMIQLAREASSNKSARLCAITWNETGGRYSDLQPFLTEFVDIKWYKIIDENSECAKRTQYYAANRTRELFATDTYLETFGENKHMIKAYPIDMKQNLVWMQSDAVNIAGPPTPRFILLQDTNFLKFLPETMELFQSKVERVTGEPVTVYSGTESLLSTIRLFTNAGGIIGFSGVAWTNDMFATYPHCNVQYHTYLDFDKETQWETFNVSAWNPVGNMQFVSLPLYQLLKGNNITDPNVYRKAEDKVVFIKKMEWLTLTHEDAIGAISRFYTCWVNKNVAYRKAQDAFGKSGNDLRD